MKQAIRQNLARLFAPRHIAFIGGRDAAVAIGEARRIGFPGTVWAVNKTRSTLAGVPCFKSVYDLPEAPDATFLAVPAAMAVEVTAQLSAMGAGGIVCYTAGFGEAGAHGEELETALVAAAGDMALVGPNCYGVISYLDRNALWPFAHGGGSPGYGAAIITQSGMLSSDILMSQRSLPLTHMISGGNQSVLSLEDFIDHLCEHPAVRAIGLHIEGLKDVQGFEAAALKSLRRGVPIVALKTGSSRIGAALTVSHTGSLSGADDLYDALFNRTGVIRVTSPSELIETLKFLCIAGPPAGNRVAGFTCSGGGATMLADHAEAIGLGFPEFGAPARGELAALLPDIATVSNPLDYTTPIWGDAARTGPVFASAIANARADVAILVQDYPAEGLDESKGSYLADAKAFIDAARMAKVPAAICSTLPENLDRETREFLVGAGVAPMQGLHETLNAVHGAIGWSAARTRICETPPVPLLKGRSAQGARALDEATGKDMLAALGLAIPRGQVVAGARVIEAARELGFPVALKMMGPRLAHKSEAGAVAVGLRSEDDVIAALAAMLNAVKTYDANAVTDRFLVEAMAPKPIAELIVGIRRDPQFGLAMTIGSGGILAELVADAETILLPATAKDMLSMLERLRATRLLRGYRGGAAADMDELIRLLLGLAEAVETRPDWIELEINPLFVCQQDIWAVDVLIHESDLR